MAQITLTIPDTIVQRVINALCAQANVPPTAANAKTALIAHVMALVRKYEAQQAADSASQTAAGNVDTQIQIT